jgi:hypothetical protein
VGVKPPSADAVVEITQGQLRTMDLQELKALVARLGLDPQGINSRNEAITLIVSRAVALR